MKHPNVRFMQAVRAVVDVLLIALGTCLLFAVIELTVAPFWLCFVLLCAGLILVFEDPNQRNYKIGIPLTVLGFFLTLRSLNIVSVPIVRWGLGGLLLLTGAVNIYRNFKGGGVAIHKTFQRDAKKDS